MNICRSVSALNEALRLPREEHSRLGFVPTMGALHDGHASLVRQSVQENDISVCSIFVNPTQFNHQTDFEAYPKTEKNDVAILRELGCDIAFIPSVREVYPNGTNGQAALVELGDLAEVMEGKFRPGHFSGVIQVVHRLFDIVKPQTAYFGEKDFQQLAVIRKMVRDLELDVRVIGCPIIREETGLALSSRNVRLSEQGKKQALALFESLKLLKSQADTLNGTLDKESAYALLEQAEGVEPEYLEIVDGNSLQPQDKESTSDYLVACTAAWVENVRLIDNMTLTPRS